MNTPSPDPSAEPPAPAEPTFGELVDLSRREFELLLSFRDREILFRGRVLSASEQEVVRRHADSVLPPLKEGDPTQFDLANPEFRAARDVAMAEARAMALVAAYPVLGAKFQDAAQKQPAALLRVLSEALPEQLLGELYRHLDGAGSVSALKISFI